MDSNRAVRKESTKDAADGKAAGVAKARRRSSSTAGSSPGRARRGLRRSNRRELTRAGLPIPPKPALSRRETGDRGRRAAAPFFFARSSLFPHSLPRTPRVTRRLFESAPTGFRLCAGALFSRSPATCENVRLSGYDLLLCRDARGRRAPLQRTPCRRRESPVSASRTLSILDESAPRSDAELAPSPPVTR